ncbi:MAG: peptidoglycan-binding domain-containing protein [Solirubrobacteraceae bacterium]
MRRYFRDAGRFVQVMLARTTAVLCTLVALIALFGAPAAQAGKRAPQLVELRCVPPGKAQCRDSVRLRTCDRVQLRGRRLKRGMRVTFRWSRGALATKLKRSRVGWTARVPAGTRAGRVSVKVTDRARRRSNGRRIVVLSSQPGKPLAAAAKGALPEALSGDAMWIWELAKSSGGDIDEIAARARAAGMRSVFVKSSDGARVWRQFTPALVSALHARGLRVCGWQFVYGSDPIGEARAGAVAAAIGADCLIIDAETRYEGRYAPAQRYMTALRAAVGPDYPLGLTSFPYVDYHPRLPYSVFLGPGGAQANLPQVYWKSIGGTVDAVSAKTFAQNRVYATPIAPVGQAYDAPRPADLRRFRAIWAGYGAGGASWWSWQAASSKTWRVLTEPPQAAVRLPDPGWPALSRGSSGDQVIWMQQHLASFDQSLEVQAGGRFTSATAASLRAFQTARGLPATGETDAATWRALLALPARPVDWTALSG